jgi:hypothetical protein
MYVCNTEYNIILPHDRVLSLRIYQPHSFQHFQLGKSHCPLDLEYQISMGHHLDQNHEGGKYGYLQKVIRHFLINHYYSGTMGFKSPGTAGLMTSYIPGDKNISI